MKTVKPCHASTCTIWKKLRWKSLLLLILKSIAEIIKILRVYMILGDAVSKLETFVWILNHISRSITWSLFTLEASYLVKWSISTWSFMCWYQLIDLLKFKTHSSSLLNFGMANSQESPVLRKVLLLNCCMIADTGIQLVTYITSIYVPGCSTNWGHSKT